MKNYLWSIIILTININQIQLASADTFVSGQSESKGFISDSKLDVLVRSYYFNSNKKDGGVDNRDWSGAIQGNYSSGFTWGTIGKPLFCGAF
ncbi:hypothetical protein DRX19_28075 [Salmonella enterica subsp. enterica]|nr:hypothetical protein [Salmonella enterica subsp. enterica serovar Pensacola]